MNMSSKSPTKGKRISEPFAQVPRIAIADKKIERELRLLAYMHDRMNSQRQVWVHRETIASDLGMNIRTVDEKLARLVDYGWLTKEKRNRKNSGRKIVGNHNLYTVATSTEVYGDVARTFNWDPKAKPPQGAGPNTTNPTDLNLPSTSCFSIEQEEWEQEQKNKLRGGVSNKTPMTLPAEEIICGKRKEAILSDPSLDISEEELRSLEILKENEKYGKYLTPFKYTSRDVENIRTAISKSPPNTFLETVEYAAIFWQDIGMDNPGLCGTNLSTKTFATSWLEVIRRHDEASLQVQELKDQKRQNDVMGV